VVYVLVNSTMNATTHDVRTEPQAESSTAELVEVLRAQVEDLRSCLDREREANRENRRIIAGLIERVPEIEAPTQEPREPDLRARDAGPTSIPLAGTGPETDASTPSGEARAPWWRRLFR
jgi:hypothetical protein